MIKKSKKKKQFIAQVTVFILISSGISFMLVGTDVYDEIHDSIVEVLCLSCLKLDPKTVVNFTFETADNKAHPDYVLDNLSSGVVFLHFSEDACPGCEIMDPIIKELFSIDFEKKGMFSTHLKYNGRNMTYFYTNIDHATKTRIDPIDTYDVLGLKMLPMFTIITLGYDKGVIKPKLATLYGTLGRDSDEKRMVFLKDSLEDSFRLWSENILGYEK